MSSSPSTVRATEVMAHRCVQRVGACSVCSADNCRTVLVLLGIFLTANFYCQCHLPQTFKRSLKIAFKICFFLCYFFFLVKCAAGVQSVVIFVRSWTMEFRRYCLIFFIYEEDSDKLFWFWEMILLAIIV